MFFDNHFMIIMVIRNRKEKAANILWWNLDVKFMCRCAMKTLLVYFNFMLNPPLPSSLKKTRKISENFFWLGVHQEDSWTSTEAGGEWHGDGQTTLADSRAWHLNQHSGIWSWDHSWQNDWSEQKGESRIHNNMLMSYDRWNGGFCTLVRDGFIMAWDYLSVFKLCGHLYGTANLRVFQLSGVLYSCGRSLLKTSHKSLKGVYLLFLVQGCVCDIFWTVSVESICVLLVLTWLWLSFFTSTSGGWSREKVGFSIVAIWQV